MKHIALIFGGPSPEHDVSLVSAKNIFQVLTEAQFKVSLLGVTQQRTWKLIKGDDLLKTDFINPIKLDQLGIEVLLTPIDNKVFIQSMDSQDEKVGPVDIAFPIVHGPYGEDGELQGELNKMQLPFVGSDIFSCENSFDKVKTKDLLSQHKIPQVPYLVFTDENPSFGELDSKLGSPFFVKPANMGSSIGITKVSQQEDLATALAEARIHDKKIIIEKGVKAREIECALLEDGELKVSGMGEVIPHHDFYSYEAKYLDPQGADLVIPASVTPEQTQTIQAMALRAFQALDCRDFARADFFLTDSGEIYFNEINTHPGFTNISQFPMLWKQEGIAYKELIIKLINNANKRS